MPESRTATGEDLPQRFGEFLLFDKIGQGGMAEIFLAKSLGTLGQQRLTVIKRVLPLLSADPQFAEMLIEEAKLCASLSHKNVVQVTDLGRVEDQLYIAMEYVEGFDLNALLRRCTRAKVPLPAEFVFLILEETLRALDYAHRATGPQGRPLQVIHRDVSPTNVLISCEGEVKLCDFGIARAVTREGALPPGALKGKFAYMSPEQASASHVDQRSDLFAAGILLWEMIAGHRLYKGDANQVLEQARVGEVPPLPDRGLPLYEHLALIVQRSLDPDPTDRFQTAREMLDVLGDYVQEAELFASQIRFSRFLTENFGEDLQCRRRERERASTAMGPKPDVSPVPNALLVEPEIKTSPEPPRLEIVAGPVSPPPQRKADGSPSPPLSPLPATSAADSAQPSSSSSPPSSEIPMPVVPARRPSRPELSIGLLQERSMVPPELTDFQEQPSADESWKGRQFSEPPETVPIAPQPSTPKWLWIVVALVALAAIAAVGYVATS